MSFTTDRINSAFPLTLITIHCLILIWHLLLYSLISDLASSPSLLNIDLASSPLFLNTGLASSSLLNTDLASSPFCLY